MDALPNVNTGADTPAPRNWTMEILVEPTITTIPATLSRVTATDPPFITKVFSMQYGPTYQGLRPHKATVARLTAGEVERITVTSLAELADVLKGLGPTNALIHGVAKRDGERVPIVSKAEWEARGRPDAVVPRTKEQFEFPAGGGTMLLDYDPADGEEPLARDALVAALRTAAPALAEAAMLWYPSASSGVWLTDADGQRTEPYTALRGQHVYLLVRDARDIPRAGEVLFRRLWLAGFGRIGISESGAMLNRTLIDAAVLSHERLDFIGGAKCHAGFVQDRGDPVIVEGSVEFVDTAVALSDLSNDEQAEYERLVHEAELVARPQADETRAQWADARATEIVARNPGMTKDKARSIAMQACTGQTLAAEWLVEVIGHGTVSVAEILAAPEKFHGCITRDPVEPRYRDGAEVGRIYTDGVPNIHSMAHGGRTFHLSALTTEEVAASAAGADNLKVRPANVVEFAGARERTRDAVRFEMNRPMSDLEMEPDPARAEPLPEVAPCPASNFAALHGWLMGEWGLDEAGARVAALSFVTTLAAREYSAPTHIHAIACGPRNAVERLPRAVVDMLLASGHEILVRTTRITSPRDIFAALNHFPSRLYLAHDLVPQAIMAKRQTGGQLDHAHDKLRWLMRESVIKHESRRELQLASGPSDNGPIVIREPAIGMLASVPYGEHDPIDPLFNRRASAKQLAHEAAWFDVGAGRETGEPAGLPAAYIERAQAVCPPVLEDATQRTEAQTVKANPAFPPSVTADRVFSIDEDAAGVTAGLPAGQTFNILRIARAVAAWESPAGPRITRELVEWARSVVVRGAAEYAEHEMSQRNDDGKRGINTKIMEVVSRHKEKGFLSSQLPAVCPEYKDRTDKQRQEHLDALILDGSIARSETRQRSHTGGKNYRLWNVKQAPEKALIATRHEVALHERAAS